MLLRRWYAAMIIMRPGQCYLLRIVKPNETTE